MTSDATTKRTGCGRWIDVNGLGIQAGDLLMGFGPRTTRPSPSGNGTITGPTDARVVAVTHKRLEAGARYALVTLAGQPLPVQCWEGFNYRVNR